MNKIKSVCLFPLTCIRSRRFWKLIGVIFLSSIPLVGPPVCEAMKQDPTLALKPRVGQRITDLQGDLYINWPEQGERSATDPAKLPKHLVNAVLAREDQRFFEHNGVDGKGIGRALIRDIAARKIVQGGSTITMQLVEMTYGYSESTILKKFQAKIFEVVMARKVEKAARDEMKGDKKKAKRLIMARYLDRIPMGGQRTGIQAAADATFGKDVAELNLGECAYLAGLIRAPSLNNVYGHEQNALKARDAVVKNMVKLKMISLEQARKAKFFALPKPKVPKRRSDGFTPQLVAQELANLQKQGVVPADLFHKHSDVEIRISADLKLQDSCLAALVSMLDKIESQQGRAAIPAERLNGAVVVIDNLTGNLLSVVGGRNYDWLQLNLAMQGQGRSFASAIKAFIYAAFLDYKGGQMGTVISNAAITTDEATGYRGNLAPKESLTVGFHPLWKALAESSNRSALRASLQLGIYHWSRYMQNLHLIDGPSPKNTSLFLGSGPVLPVKAAAAYATLARRGDYIPPALIQTIYVEGKIVYQRQISRSPVFKGISCDEVTKGLGEVLRQGTAANFGGVELARKLHVVGKTGTTDDGTDAWFCGYSSEVTVVVWVGYPHKAKPISSTASGGSIAFPVWKAIMEKAAERKYTFKSLPELDRAIANQKSSAQQSIPKAKEVPFENSAPRAKVAIEVEPFKGFPPSELHPRATR